MHGPGTGRGPAQVKSAISVATIRVSVPAVPRPLNKLMLYSACTGPHRLAVTEETVFALSIILETKASTVQKVTTYARLNVRYAALCLAFCVSFWP